jgi:CRP/FNR family transcriptional regulator
VLERGEMLFREGSDLQFLYLLRSGSVKTSVVTEDGEEHILRFHMPGDILGLGAISTGTHDCSATSLDTSSFCCIPFNRYRQLAAELPAVNYQLLLIMSRQVSRDERMMLVKTHGTASQRVASFIDELSRDHSTRGYSAVELNLAMERRDIANYLGLSLETVSRILSRLQDQGLLHVNRKRIRIRDRLGLARLGRLHISVAGSVTGVYLVANSS